MAIDINALTSGTNELIRARVDVSNIANSFINYAAPNEPDEAEFGIGANLPLDGASSEVGIWVAGDDVEFGSGTEHTLLDVFHLAVRNDVAFLDLTFESGEFPSDGAEIGSGKSVYVLNENGDLYAKHFTTFGSSGFEGTATQADIDALVSLIDNTSNGEQWLFVIADEGVEIAPEVLQLTDLPTGTNEQIRLLTTVGAGAAGEFEYNEVGPVGSIEGDNASESPAVDPAVHRFRMRRASNSRRVILNITQGTNQIPSGRSLYIYDGTTFLELAGGSRDGSGGGFVRWIGHLNSSAISTDYDAIADNLEAGDTLLLVIADTGSIPSPNLIQYEDDAVAGTPVASAVLSVVAAAAIAYASSAVAGTPVATASLSVSDAGSIQYQDDAVAGEPQSSAILSVVTAGAISYRAVSVAEAPVATARLTVNPAGTVQYESDSIAGVPVADAMLSIGAPVPTSYEDDAVAGTPVATAVLTIRPAGQVRYESDAVAGVPMSSSLLAVIHAGSVNYRSMSVADAPTSTAELTITSPPRIVFLGAEGVAGAPRSTAVLRIVQDPAEQAILDDIAGGDLDFIGDQRLNAMELISNVIERKSGMLDEAITVHQSIVSYRNELTRREDVRDGGQVDVMLRQLGGDVNRSLGVDVVMRSYIEVNFLAYDWDACRAHAREALDALNRQRRVKITNEVSDEWDEEFDGHIVTFQVAVLN